MSASYLFGRAPWCAPGDNETEQHDPAIGAGAEPSPAFGDEGEIAQRERALREQRDQPLRPEVRGEVGHRPVVARGSEEPDCDVAEAGGAQQPGKAPPDEPVTAAAGLGRRDLGVYHRGLGEQGFRQPPQGSVNLDHGKQATGPQHAQCLGEHLLGCGDVLDDVPHQYAADAAAAQRQSGGVAAHERAATAAPVAKQIFVDVEGDHRQAGQRTPEQPGHRPAARAKLKQRRGAGDAEVAQDP
jgi:hypothetical protein